jgi:hypothetical protein
VQSFLIKECIFVISPLPLPSTPLVFFTSVFDGFFYILSLMNVNYWVFRGVFVLLWLPFLLNENEESILGGTPRK